MIDTAIISNRTITPAGIKKAVVLIRNGKIADVVDNLPEGDFPVTEVGDNVLMPGIVDPHVHINEPGRVDWEGFDTATKAAIAGGITSLVEMPLNASPVTTTAKAFDEKIQSSFDKLRMTTKLHTNCGFWGGVIPGNEKDIEPLIERGVLGFKAFLTHSGIEEFPNVMEDDLRKAMPIIAKHGLPLLVHCELEHTSNTLRQASTNQVLDRQGDKQSYQNYLLSRPKKWEDDAIALMIRLCEQFNCRVHIVHVSSASSIIQIEQAKQKGLPLTAETAQHYLYFCAEEIKDGQTQFKCAPPIRNKANNNQLWKALQNGILNFVATDHSPATPDLKEITSGNFLKAWGGIASLQIALPVLWTAAKQRNIGVVHIAKWLSENPAKLIGLEHKKGRIEKGYDADLVIWNPDESFTVTEQMILHKHKITPYLGEQLYGTVHSTYLGGMVVYHANGQLQLQAGSIITRQL